MTIHADSTIAEPEAAALEPARRPVPFLLDDRRARRTVDGARAVGILLVVFFHTLFGLTKLLPAEGLDRFIARFPAAFNVCWQALGSEVIFLLSGFLLSYLLVREHRLTDAIDLRDYFVRRGSRILPLYALALALYCAAVRFDGRDLVLNVLFVSKVLDAKTIIPVGWSLELMMQVYVLLPFLVLATLRSRRPLTFVGLLLIGSVVPRYWALVADPEACATTLSDVIHGADFSRTHEDLYYLIWFRATPFLAGLFLACLTIQRGAWLRAAFGRPAVAVGAPLFGLALLVASGFLPIHDGGSLLYRVAGPRFWLWFWTLQRPLFVAGLALLLLSAWYASRGPGVLFSRTLTPRVGGTISRNIYSIYLFHFACLIPVAALVLWTVDRDAVRDVTSLQAVAIFALTATLSVLLASVLTRWIEVPAQRWLRRRYGRQP